MGVLDPPPRHFALLTPIMREVDPQQLIRIGRQGVGRHEPGMPLEFRREGAYRFDAPNGEYGVCYAALDLATAFLEAVLRGMPQEKEPGDAIIIGERELLSRCVIRFEATADIRLRLIVLSDAGFAACYR